MTSTISNTEGADGDGPAMFRPVDLMQSKTIRTLCKKALAQSNNSKSIKEVRNLSDLVEILSKQERVALIEEMNEGISQRVFKAWTANKYRQKLQRNQS